DVPHHVDIRQQLLAGGIDVGGRFADREQHIRIIFDRGALRTYPATLVVKVGGQRSLGDADHRGGDAKREHIRPRHLVKRFADTGFLLRGAVDDLVAVHDPVGRYESVADDDVLGAGSFQPHHIPGVLDDLVVAAGQDHVQHGRRVGDAAVGIAQHGAEENPVAVVGAGAELPSAVEKIAAVGRDGDAGGRIWRGHPGVVVGAPDLFAYFR